MDGRGKENREVGEGWGGKEEVEGGDPERSIM